MIKNPATLRTREHLGLYLEIMRIKLIKNNSAYLDIK